MKAPTRQHPAAQTTPDRFRLHRARRRGSTLLLVIAALLMAMFLGLAFLQIARQDRLGATNMQNTDALDQITQAAVNAVGAELIRDLGVSDSGTPASTADDKLFVNSEPYDYPGSLDLWLAASAPSTAAAPFTWSQISRLNPLTTAKYADGSTTQSIEAVSTPASPTINPSPAPIPPPPMAHPTVAPTSKDRGVFADTDGDGIIDSKFEVAPIPSLNGIDYYVAVRIIDNSALVNLNTALPVANSSGAYDTSTDASTSSAPRWWYPSDIDLAGFIYSFTTAGMPNAVNTSGFPDQLKGIANYINEDLKRLMGYRLGLAPTTYVTTSPMPWGVASVNQRGHFWLNGPALYDNFLAPYKQIGIDAELALRHRNGLVHPSSLSAIDGKNNTYSMQYLLRTDTSRFPPSGTDPVVESNYTKADWTNSTTDGSAITTIGDFFNKEPRHQLTTVSGASIFSPRLTADGSTIIRKRDLNKATAADLAIEIKNVFNQAPTFIPFGGTSAPNAADNFAAAIKDYADADNLLTSSGTNRFGMEALPFLTEAYAQRPYAATSTGVAPNITISWSSAGTAGYAIEIRNPFNRTISLQNVNLWVANANWGPLNTLAGQATLPPNAILILYRNSTGGSNDDISLLIAPGAITKAITNDWPTAAAPVTLELRATNQTGAPLTWAYSKIINAVSMPDSVSLTNQSAPITGADYRQATTIGNGQKINIMLTPPSGFIPFTEQTAAYAADIDRLGDTPKPGQPTGKIADANLNKNQLLFRDDAHGLITSVGELAHIAFVPLDGTKTFAEAWGTASDAAQHMLNFAGPVVTGQAIPTSPAGPQYEAVPHAMLVLDRFTTLSPYEDGVDNDNDQTVTGDIDENFVPGTININTATTDVIRYAIPLPASLRASGANDVAAALVGYRDNAAKRPTAITGLRTAKGIASLGEIYNIFNPQNAPTVANPLASDTTDNRSIDGMLIDDIANASNTSGDAIVDDREEAAAILRMLSQVCSVRSDIFTAYIVIRGFPNDLKPSDLAILNPTVTADAKKLSDYYARVTERRLIVVFDRSRVTDIASPIHILGFYQY